MCFLNTVLSLGFYVQNEKEKSDTGVKVKLIKAASLKSVEIPPQQSQKYTGWVKLQKASLVAQW